MWRMGRHEWVSNYLKEAPHSSPYLPDKDLKTQGFTLESCRSMIALMDVSFPPPFPTMFFCHPSLCSPWGPRQ